MGNRVFINNASSFLPNLAVKNEEIESYLGLIEGRPSRVRNIVLRQNGINLRYYALTKQQTVTHTNAELAANAIHGLFRNEEELRQIELLTAASSIPDQILPSHASMIHGVLQNNPMEILSFSGVCLTSLQALKYAYLSILAGDKKNAVCCASELVSATLLSKHYEAEYEKCHSVGENPYMAFEKDFLRFMLSDGAGAVLLENKPNKTSISLKIEWIEIESFANELPTCMLLGGDFGASEEILSWKIFDSQEISDKSIFVVKQDIKLLKKYVIEYWVNHIEKSLCKHGISASEINYVIPHVSSMFFYSRLDEEISKRNLDLAECKWYTNLPKVGNMGSASIFVALEEFLKTKTLKSGDRILLLVPESGRFSYGTALLCVE